MRPPMLPPRTYSRSKLAATHPRRAERDPLARQVTAEIDHERQDQDHQGNENPAARTGHEHGRQADEQHNKSNKHVLAGFRQKMVRHSPPFDSAPGKISSDRGHQQNEPNRRARAEIGRGSISVDEGRGQTSEIRGLLAPQDPGWVKHQRKDAVDGVADPCPRHDANAPARSIRINSDNQAKNERKHVCQRRSKREERLSPYDRYRRNKLLSQGFRRFGPYGIECSNPGMV